jgi:beta-N-acetylhexosaminidase
MASRRLSPAAKVGQLFMVGFEGTTVTPELRGWMREFAWGGLIIFGRNVVSPAQLAALTQALQETAQAEVGMPLLIAVDQEGGRVARLPAPFTAFPSAATLGATGSPALVRRVAAAIGRELAAVGINMDMAPVLDVLTNPANTVIGDRAFSGDPAAVARLGTAFMHGLHAAGVLATGKHFPGHGATQLDSHVAQPLCERSREQLRRCELRPFRAAVAAGIAALMTAHVVYPAWDARAPATLSPHLVTRLLRQAIGYDGVVISDDLEMAGVTQGLPWEEVPLLALRAGVDVLLICHHPERQAQAHRRLLRALQAGELPEAAVDRAVARIHRLKQRLAQLRRAVAEPPALDCIGSAAHHALADAVRASARRTAEAEECHDA